MKLRARRLDGRAIEVEIAGGRFARINRRDDPSPDLPLIAPGLVDIQVNGFAGVDFNRGIESDEAWRHVTGELYAHGCTGFLVTLITNSEEGYRSLLPPWAARLRDDSRNALGFHFEGPWLNPDPGYRGAHRAEWMSRPEPQLLRAWREATGGLLRLITLAPEIDPETSLAVIREGSGQGVRFFAGHSAAMGATLERAVEAGLAGWTHLGNAAPSPAPKFDNVIMHALAQEALPASLIPDGIHLPPHVLSVLAAALDWRLLLTTDAMAGAAAPPGSYTLGEVAVEVGPDGSARLPGSGRLAGSTLTPLEGVRRAGTLGGLDFASAWEAFSTRPARILGLEHGITEGRPADFCLLTPGHDLLATHHRGECVYRRD